MRIPRLPWDAFFMLNAHLAATRSTCDRGPELFLDPGRHGVGAVLVKNNRIIATGYNGSPPGQPHCDELCCNVCKKTLHIEIQRAHADSNLLTPCVCFENSTSIEWFPVEHVVGKEHINCSKPYDTYNCTYSNGHWEGGHIIKDGHCVRTIHAERNALLQCALDGTSPEGATLYSTASPCFDCAKDLIRVGVRKVFFAYMYESRYGLSSDVKDLLERSTINVAGLDVKKYLER
jgi:deoxycytidylate deaminase